MFVEFGAYIFEHAGSGGYAPQQITGQICTFGQECPHIGGNVKARRGYVSGCHSILQLVCPLRGNARHIHA